MEVLAMCFWGASRVHLLLWKQNQKRYVAIITRRQHWISADLTTNIKTEQNTWTKIQWMVKVMTSCVCGWRNDTHPPVSMQGATRPLLLSALVTKSLKLATVFTLSLAETQREMLILEAVIAESFSIPWYNWLKQLINTELWDKLVWVYYRQHPMNK